MRNGWGMAFLAALTATPVLAQQASPAVEVGVLSMQRQEVPQGFDLPGRAVAYEQVAIRPRVGGIVTQILYTPGKEVRAGDPLFQLDDATYQAAVANDRAALVTAEANLPVKQAAFDRAQRLLNQGATRVDLETAQYDLAAAKATLEAARAALDFAQTQLSWTTVRAPIEGIPEVQEVSVGDLVTAGQTTAMTTLTRLDPIYVDMLEPSTRLLEIRRRIEDGTMTANRTMDATLVLEDGEIYTGKGTLVTPSAVVSATTGTVAVRFAFENPGHKILPGMFLRGTVTQGTTRAWLVPQRAAARSAMGDLTAFIIAEGKAKRVTLTPSGTWQNNWVVTAGLSDGDQLIVDGLKSMTPGKAVTGVPATIDAAGLVQDAPKAE